jgi:thioredoxin-like negative regulator of GroEL
MDPVPATVPLPPRERFIERAGRALARRRPEQVSKLAQAFLTREPASVEARLALASAAWLAHDWAQAAAHAIAACDGEEALREAADLAAVCYGLAGDLPPCMYYAKLAAALPARPDLALLLPPDLPPLPRILYEIDDSALLQRSLRALASSDLGAAEHWLQQHLAFRPDCADGHLQLALVVLAQGRIRAAAPAACSAAPPS